MTSAFACVGDKTDHGGIVITGSSLGSVEGRAIACVGDMVRCPKCGGLFPIVSSKAPFVSFGGKPAAYAGDKTACGASLLATQSLASANQSSGVAGESDPAPLQTEKGRFRLLDDTTGQPIRSRSYTVTSSDGQTISGSTDENGMTDWIEGSVRATLQLKHFE